MDESPSTIHAWITNATARLAGRGIPSARLDAELMLAHVLRTPRTWLHAHSDTSLTTRALAIANACLTLRLDHVPVAYIIGHKEFYGRRFHVTPATLIPRPESETIITLLGTVLRPTHHTLLDVGTGTGCLGITAKLQHPTLDVTLSDISHAALLVATKNATSLKAHVHTRHSNLLLDIPGVVDIIIANLPYVDKEWEVSPDTAHEPALALFADAHGTALITTLLEQATTHLTPAGYLLLEADPCQHADIITFAEHLGYLHDTTQDYVVVLRRG